jgi:DNA-binding CsgD family transcriptional regulator
MTVICTEKESEVIRLVCEGFKTDDIAEILGVTPKTIKWHLTNIYQKNDCVNRADLIIKFFKGQDDANQKRLLEKNNI